MGDKIKCGWLVKVNKILYLCSMTDKTKEFLQKLKDSGHWNDEYDSVVGAAKLLNCNPETIRSACNGINKTGKGFKWKYK